ncbi:sulfonate ABC transporter substrate-binding protein [Alkalinema pantanalense CENA528]|uniref:sulfonate ABC transporter substrate-binding protein n=1 Tax=Alkalinema pantanalense TaxID=1620705 RepID=UPI003D6F8A7F
MALQAPIFLTALWQRIQPRFARSSLQAFLSFMAIGLSLSLVVSACSSGSQNNQATSPNSSPSNNANSANSGLVVKIGYQKAATILSLLKENKDLEKALAASGGTVQWAEFPAGPPLLEAMNSGSVDFGYTGEAPPIFAQAAGTPVRYVAYDPLSTKAEAIVVPKDSPIQKLEDLKGKKIAFAKGSNTNYLVVKALESVGLSLSDVDVVHLTPADARAAFETGKVDAWAIWDPYLAVAETKIGAKQIVDATGLAPNKGYYLASQSFIDKHPEVLKTVLDEVRKRSDWAKSNPTEVTKFLAPSLGIDPAPLELAEKRREYGVLPLTAEIIAKQQEIADTFSKIKLIPKEIKVQDIVWKGNS